MAREFKCFDWRAMYASVSAQTVIEWEDHFSQHGFTHHNENLRHGIACAVNHDVTLTASGYKVETPASPYTFIPNYKYEPDIPAPSDDELMAAGLAAGGLRFECPDC